MVLAMQGIGAVLKSIGHQMSHCVAAVCFGGLYILAAVPAILRDVAAPPSLASCLLLLLLAALSGIDVLAQRLPNELTLSLLAVGLVVTALVTPDALIWHAVGAAAGLIAFWGIAALYRRLRDRDGLGGGDAKFLSAIGAWVGLDGLPSVLLIACASALGLLIATRRLNAWTQRIAFGPFLALGCWLTWLYGPLV